METKMYLAALENVLAKRYSKDTYNIGGYQEMSVCIQPEKDGWVVYTGERGNRYGEVHCSTILEGCLEFFRKMTSIVEDLSSMENELLLSLSKVA